MLGVRLVKSAPRKYISTMETRHIINCGTQSDIPKDLAPAGPEAVWREIHHWLSTVPRFCKFAETNRSKIKSKFEKAGDNEKVRDVLTEIEIACRFLADPELEVDYEPFGDGEGRSPDFRIRSQRYGDFIVEAKRIREAAHVTLFHKCIDRIISELRKVPSSLGVSFKFRSLNLPRDYASRLDSSIDSIISLCLEALRSATGKLTSGDSITIAIKGFEELQLCITHVPEKSPDTPTANFGGVFSTLYTQRESFKFTDLVLNSLGQLRPDLPNVLTIRSHSTTHEPEELPMVAIANIERSAKGGNDLFFQKKGFKDIADYKQQVQHLSAVVVLPYWIKTGDDLLHNEVWCNPAATKPLHEAVVEYLRTM